VTAVADPSALARTLALPVRAADRLRLAYLRALGPLARPIVRDRELRVALSGTLLLVTALAATALVPLWLLALGPIVWGVPHAMSDVRYLWVRPGYHRRWILWAVALAPLVVLTFTTSPAWGLVGAAGAALVARGSIVRKALVLAALVPAIALAYLEEAMATLVLAHAHNLIGIALWWSWRARDKKLHWIPLGVFAVGSGAILLGALDPAVIWAGGFDAQPGGMSVYYHLASLAPDGIPGLIGARLVLLFAFAQSAHYVVWVRLVPEEDRPRETPRTFAASLRALAADFGWPLLLLTFAAALGIAVWATIDLLEARAGYLRAVLFHGHLEIAAAALLLVEGRRAHAPR
jgi:hypothetical protein